jgi:hypothetical protein
MPVPHCWYSLGSISRLLSSSKGRSHPKGDSHDKHILMLTAVTVALVCGGIPARAQEIPMTPQSRDIGRKRSRTRATKKTP